MRCGAYLMGAWFLLLIARTSEPQPYQNTQTSGQQTFRSPDGTFRFTYPSSYTLYTGSETDETGFYMPVCQSAVACVAYPRTTYAGTNFLAAAFQAREIDDATTENVCLRPPILAANGGPQFNTATKNPTKIINGVSFLHGISGGVAMGNYMNSDLYRTFYRSKCYELSISISATRFENFDPGAVREFTSGDEQRVTNELTMILNSFRFLK